MAVKIRDLKNDGRAWLVLHVDGRRVTQLVGRPPEGVNPTRWSVALRKARQAERQLDLGRGLLGSDQQVLFKDFVDHYLAEDTSYLAETTLHDRKNRLNGRLGDYFADFAVSEITAEALFDWWAKEIEARGLSPKTGRNELDALAGVLRYAAIRGKIKRSPVPDFRELLKHRFRTKRGRASVRPEVRPIRRPDHVAALIRQAEEEIDGDGLLVLFFLYTGVRSSSAKWALWELVWWGRDESDTTRRIEIQNTKSGQDLRIALSLRLRRHLRERWLALGQPEGRIFPFYDESNAIKRLTQLCKRAKIPRARIKDLRDTFACHLLSMGVPLGWISRQLGHANVSITARHYAQWIEPENGAWQPIVPRPGELPVDLLDRLIEANPGRHQTALRRHQNTDRRRQKTL